MSIFNFNHIDYSIGSEKVEALKSLYKYITKSGGVPEKLLKNLSETVSTVV